MILTQRKHTFYQYLTDSSCWTNVYRSVLVWFTYPNAATPPPVVRFLPDSF